MRGSQRGSYRRRKPSIFSPQNGQARFQSKNALFGSDSFMRAVAATEDRQEFNRLTWPATKSQQTPRLWSANHESLQVLGGGLAGEDGLPTEGLGPARRGTSAQGDFFTTTPIQTNQERLRDSKSRQLASPSTGGVTWCHVGYDPNASSSKRHIQYPKVGLISPDRNLAMPEGSFLQAAKQLCSPPSDQKLAVEGTLDIQHTVSTPTLSAENASRAPAASPEQSTRAAYRATISDVNTYQRISSSQKAGAAGGNTQRYDIVTLERWQSANGGTGLPIAQKAALEMQVLLSLHAQPLFDRPAINVEHANNFMKSFLDQAQKANHQDVSNLTEIGQSVHLFLAPSNQIKQIVANAIGKVEEDNETPLDVAEAQRKKQDTGAEGKCVEDGAAEQGSEAIVDHFKWLLPANFR